MTQSRLLRVLCLVVLACSLGACAGPRASIYLLMAAKARAILHKRYHATTADIDAVALPVLRHRIIPTFNAEAAGVSTDDIVTRLLVHMRGGGNERSAPKPQTRSIREIAARFRGQGN